MFHRTGASPKKRPGPSSQTSRPCPVGSSHDNGDRTREPREIPSSDVAGSVVRRGQPDREQLLPYLDGRCRLPGCWALCRNLKTFLGHLSNVHGLGSTDVSKVGDKLAAAERLRQAELNILSSVMSYLNVVAPARDLPARSLHQPSSDRSPSEGHVSSKAASTTQEVRICLSRIDDPRTKVTDPIRWLRSPTSRGCGRGRPPGARGGRQNVDRSRCLPYEMIQMCLVASSGAVEGSTWLGIRTWIAANFPHCARWQSQEWEKVRGVLYRDSRFLRRRNPSGSTIWSIRDGVDAAGIVEAEELEEATLRVKVERPLSPEDVSLQVDGLYEEMASVKGEQLLTPSKIKSLLTEDSSEDDLDNEPCGGDDAFSDQSSNAVSELGKTNDNSGPAQPAPFCDGPICAGHVKVEPTATEQTEEVEKQTLKTESNTAGSHAPDWDRAFYRKSTDRPPQSDEDIIYACFAESGKERMVFSEISVWLCKNLGHFRQFTPEQWKVFRFQTLPASGLVGTKEGETTLWSLAGNGNGVAEHAASPDEGLSKPAPSEPAVTTTQPPLCRLRPEGGSVSSSKSETSRPSTDRPTRASSVPEWDRKFYRKSNDHPPQSDLDILRRCFAESGQKTMMFSEIGVWLSKNLGYFRHFTPANWKVFRFKTLPDTGLICMREGPGMVWSLGETGQEVASNAGLPDGDSVEPTVSDVAGGGLEEPTSVEVPSNGVPEEESGSDGAGASGGFESSDGESSEERASVEVLSKGVPEEESGSDGAGASDGFESSDGESCEDRASVEVLSKGDSEEESGSDWSRASDKFESSDGGSSSSEDSEDDSMSESDVSDVSGITLDSSSTKDRPEQSRPKRKCALSAVVKEEMDSVKVVSDSEKMVSDSEKSDEQNNRHVYRTNPEHPPESFRLLVRRCFERTGRRHLTVLTLQKWLCRNYAHYRKLGIKQWLAVYSVLYSCPCFKADPEARMNGSKTRLFWFKMVRRLMCDLCKAATDRSEARVSSGDVRPGTPPPCDESSGLSWDRERFKTAAVRPPIDDKLLLRQCFLDLGKRKVTSTEMIKWFADNFMYYRELDGLEFKQIRKALTCYSYFGTGRENRKFVYTFDEDFFLFNPDCYFNAKRTRLDEVHRVNGKHIEQIARRNFKWQDVKRPKPSADSTAVTAKDASTVASNAGQVEADAPANRDGQSSAATNHVDAERSRSTEGIVGGGAEELPATDPSSGDESEEAASADGIESSDVDGDVDFLPESEIADKIPEAEPVPRKGIQPNKNLPERLPDLGDLRVRRYYASHNERPCFPVWALLVRCIQESPNQRASCPMMYKWLAKNFRHYRNFTNKNWGGVRVELRHQSCFVRHDAGRNPTYSVDMNQLSDDKLKSRHLTLMQEFMDKFQHLEDQQLDQPSSSESEEEESEPDPVSEGVQSETQSQSQSGTGAKDLIEDSTPAADDDDVVPGWLLKDVRAMEEELRVNGSIGESVSNAEASIQNESQPGDAIGGAEVPAEQDLSENGTAGLSKSPQPLSERESAASPSSLKRAKVDPRDRIPELRGDKYRTSTKKPPFVLRAFLRQCLVESPAKGLTLSEIKSWVENHFPYYKQTPPAWSTVKTTLLRRFGFIRLNEGPPRTVRYAVDDDLYFKGEIPPRLEKAGGGSSIPAPDVNHFPKLKGPGYRNTTRKPPHPLSAIIRQCLVENHPEPLTAADIASWIREQFSYFAQSRSSDLTTRKVITQLRRLKYFKRRYIFDTVQVHWTIDDDIFLGKKKAKASQDSQAGIGGARHLHDKRKEPLAPAAEDGRQDAAEVSVSGVAGSTAGPETRPDSTSCSSTNVSRKRRRESGGDGSDSRERSKRKRTAMESADERVDSPDGSSSDSSVAPLRSRSRRPNAVAVSYREESSENEESDAGKGEKASVASSVSFVDEDSSDSDCLEATEDEMSDGSENSDKRTAKLTKRTSDGQSNCSMRGTHKATRLPHDKLLAELKKELKCNAKLYNETSVMPPFLHRILLVYILKQAPNEELTFNQVCDWLHKHFKYFRKNTSLCRINYMSLLTGNRCFRKTSDVTGGPWTIDYEELNANLCQHVYKRHNTTYNPRIRHRVKQLTQSRRPPPVNSKMLEESRELLLLAEDYRELATDEPPFPFHQLLRACLLSHPDEMISEKAIVSWFREKFAYFRGQPEKEMFYRVKYGLDQRLCFVSSGEGTEECPILWAFDSKLIVFRDWDRIVPKKTLNPHNCRRVAAAEETTHVDVRQMPAGGLGKALDPKIQICKSWVSILKKKDSSPVVAAAEKTPVAVNVRESSAGEAAAAASSAELVAPV